MKLTRFIYNVSAVLIMISVIAAGTLAVSLFPRPSTIRPVKVDYSKNNPLILKHSNENFGIGNYKYAYQQSDGTEVEQIGVIRNQGTAYEVLAVTGQFQWISPSGIAYIVRYTADEQGYKAEVEESLAAAQGDCAICNLTAQAPPSSHHVATLLG